MLGVDRLPAGTRALLNLLSRQSELKDSFALIGGTAIALHHAHRRSDDLDFRATTLKLPRRKIDKLLGALERAGEKLRLIPDEAALEDWENAGDDLRDYQQDWSAGQVKLTFFANHDAEDAAYVKTHIGARIGNVAVLSSNALFALKSRLLLQRATSRDLFDLWFYVAKRGKPFDAIVGEALAAGRGRYEWDFVKARLLERKTRADDPGFESLIDDAPQTRDEVVDALTVYADDYEARLAARLLAKDLK